MNQQLFDDLTAEAPPSTIDVAGIVRREKRRRAAVRAGVPVTAALAVAVAVGALGIGHGPAPGPSAVASAAAPAPGSGASSGASSGARSGAPSRAPRFRLAAQDKAAMVATATTLRAALDAAVHEAAPGSRWLEQGLTAAPTPDGEPPRIVADNARTPSDPMFSGVTGIGLDGRRGTLGLSVIALDSCTGPLAKCAPSLGEGLYGCQPAALTCTAGTTGDGRRQRVRTTTSLGGFISQETTVELADGRALMITVDNQFSPPGSKDNRDNVAQEAAPLSPAQVKAIATTIGDQILP
jgi:hypothetical protein